MMIFVRGVLQFFFINQMQIIVNPSLTNKKFMIPFFLFSVLVAIMSSLITSPNNRTWFLTGGFLFLQFISFILLMVYPDYRWTSFFFNFINFIFISSYLYTIYFQSIEKLFNTTGGISKLGYSGGFVFFMGIVLTILIKFLINKTTSNPSV